MTTLQPPFHAKDMEGLYKKVIKGKLYSPLFNLLREFCQNSNSLLIRSFQCCEVPFVGDTSPQARLWEDTTLSGSYQKDE